MRTITIATFVLCCAAALLNATPVAGQVAFNPPPPGQPRMQPGMQFSGYVPDGSSSVLPQSAGYYGGVQQGGPMIGYAPGAGQGMPYGAPAYQARGQSGCWGCQQHGGKPDLIGPTQAWLSHLVYDTPITPNDGVCADGGCGPIGSGGGYYPVWRARLGAVHLHRNVSDHIAFSVINSPNGVSTQMSTDDLKFQHQFSGVISLERRVPGLHGNNSVEISYMGGSRWNDQKVTFDPFGNLFSPYRIIGLQDGPTDFNAPGYDNANWHVIAYSSELHNAELNYWVPLAYRWGGFKTSFLFGARWVGLYEDFDYTSLTSPNDPTQGGLTLIKTHNNLVGGQIGWSTTYAMNQNFSLRWDGKAGVYNNFAEQITFITAPNALSFGERSRHTTGTFVGGSSLVCTHQWSCNWQTFVGYQVMWMDKLALAPENFNPEFPFPTRTATVDVGGELFLHGGMAGIEASW